MEDNFRDTVLFNGIGTDKVVIGHSAKMGSTSLDHFQQDNSEFIKYLKNEPYDENKILSKCIYVFFPVNNNNNRFLLLKFSTNPLPQPFLYFAIHTFPILSHF